MSTGVLCVCVCEGRQVKKLINVCKTNVFNQISSLMSKITLKLTELRLWRRENE